jgi:hypothetical protein
MALPQPDRMSGVAPAHVRHKPEQTLLYQLVEQYWPDFQTQLSETGRFLSRHVTREFEDYLTCGRLENGFEARALRELQPRASGLGRPRTFSCKRRGFCGAAFGPAVAPDAWWRRLRFWCIKQ